MTLSLRTRIRICRDADWKCFYCGAELENNATVDYKGPTQSNGIDDESNLVACCSSCKLAKGSTSLEDFRAQLYNKSDRFGSVHFSLRDIINLCRSYLATGDPILCEEEIQRIEAISGRIFREHPPLFHGEKKLGYVWDDENGKAMLKIEQPTTGTIH